MPLKKNVLKRLYVCIHPEMYNSGAYHARHCNTIIDNIASDEASALVMIPQLELPRTFESVKRQLCLRVLTESDEAWISASALNDVETRARRILEERFAFGDFLVDLVRRNEDYDERKTDVLKQVQEQFNVEPRSLDPYDPNTLYYFERATCFGEDPGSCVPVFSHALRQLCVYTSP